MNDHQAFRWSGPATISDEGWDCPVRGWGRGDRCRSGFREVVTRTGGGHCHSQGHPGFPRQRCCQSRPRVRAGRTCRMPSLELGGRHRHRRRLPSRRRGRSSRSTPPRQRGTKPFSTLLSWPFPFRQSEVPSRWSGCTITETALAFSFAAFTDGKPGSTPAFAGARPLPENALMAMPVPAASPASARAAGAEQDHGLAAGRGLVGIADTDRPDRADRTRLAARRAHNCRRIPLPHGSKFRRIALPLKRGADDAFIIITTKHLVAMQLRAPNTILRINAASHALKQIGSPTNSKTGGTLSLTDHQAQ
jgi:hypothetical protein